MWPFGSVALKRAVLALASAATTPCATAAPDGTSPSSAAPGGFGAAAAACNTTGGIVGKTVGPAVGATPGGPGGAPGARASVVGAGPGEPTSFNSRGGGGGFGGPAALQAASPTAVTAATALRKYGAIGPRDDQRDVMTVLSPEASESPPDRPAPRAMPRILPAGRLDGQRFALPSGRGTAGRARACVPRSAGPARPIGA